VLHGFQFIDGPRLFQSLAALLLDLFMHARLQEINFDHQLAAHEIKEDFRYPFPRL
jgi:hypothetical protein